VCRLQSWGLPSAVYCCMCTVDSMPDGVRFASHAASPEVRVLVACHVHAKCFVLTAAGIEEWLQLLREEGIADPRLLFGGTWDAWR
jgi:hypothetical protein